MHRTWTVNGTLETTITETDIVTNEGNISHFFHKILLSWNYTEHNLYMELCSAGKHWYASVPSPLVLNKIFIIDFNYNFFFIFITMKTTYIIYIQISFSIIIKNKQVSFVACILNAAEMRYAESFSTWVGYIFIPFFKFLLELW